MLEFHKKTIREIGRILFAIFLFSYFVFLLAESTKPWSY